MQIQTRCGCVVTLKPYIPYFNHIFIAPFNTTVKMCNEHRTLLTEESKIQLDRMYSEKLLELQLAIEAGSVS